MDLDVLPTSHFLLQGSLRLFHLHHSRLIGPVLVDMVLDRCRCTRSAKVGEEQKDARLECWMTRWAVALAVAVAGLGWDRPIADSFSPSSASDIWRATFDMSTGIRT
jgi:hypothetical protein